MENNKLYLSVRHSLESFLKSDIRIRVHDNTCYVRYLSGKDIGPLLPTPHNWFYLNNVNELAKEIEETLSDYFYFNDKYDYIPDEIPVIALRIATFFIDNNEKQTMWNISDLENIYPVRGFCCGCHLCDMSDESEEDKDEEENYEEENYEEKNYILPMINRMDYLEDQIYNLKNEIFPNDELSIRAQIKMINDRLDKLEGNNNSGTITEHEKVNWHINHIYNNLSEMKNQIEKNKDNIIECYNELFVAKEGPLSMQISELNDYKNITKSIFNDHENRLNDLDNENKMISSMIYISRYFNNDKSPHTGDKNKC